MVLFKFGGIGNESNKNKIYIPLWSYSNDGKNTPADSIALIYIPLWSYSNDNVRVVDNTIAKFTFHYGPIQILQINCNTLFIIHLHSTMVLFKWY